MGERRSLTDGLRATPTVDPVIARQFIHGGHTAEPSASRSSANGPTSAISRSQISVRIRSELATALKRASLERQLGGTEPNTLQDIIELALEPWLRTNGYMS